jgi:isopenicillin N synthase-like dioxygenase
MMKASLNVIAAKSIKSFEVTPKKDWLKMDPAQVTLVINLVNWVQNVEKGLLGLKANPKSMHKTLDD